MAEIKENNCPGCERHCKAEGPSCNWGRTHFGMELLEERKPLSWAEKRKLAKHKKENK